MIRVSGKMIKREKLGLKLEDVRLGIWLKSFELEFWALEVDSVFAKALETQPWITRTEIWLKARAPVAALWQCYDSATTDSGEHGRDSKPLA